MKQRFLLSSAACAWMLAVVPSCSQPGPAATGSGGGPGASSGGNDGASSGGAPGSGGSSSGMGSGGAATTGSSGGAGGGATGTGASGGTTPGDAGASGAVAGAGAGATGSAGRGSGGAAGRGAGGGGPAGGSAAGGAGAVSIASVVPKLDGYLWIGTCAAGAPSTGSATDCPIYPDGVSTCPMVNAVDYNTRGAIRTDTIPILGTSGTRYTITFEVRGVAGARCYNGGTRVPALSADPEGPNGNDGWQVGGTPTDSKWNTWEFHVYPPGSTTESGVYYLNAFPSTSIYCERHETFVMSYSASFPVQGGGMIRAVIHDSNCAGQQNCGAPDNQTTCGSPRKVSVTGLDPQPPDSFVQPPITNTYHPQWLFFDVKSVTTP